MCLVPTADYIGRTFNGFIFRLNTTTMTKKVAVTGLIMGGPSVSSLAIAGMHQVKDLIVTAKAPDPTPLPKIVIKPGHYAYMRSEADPAPAFFRTRHRKQH